MFLKRRVAAVATGLAAAAIAVPAASASDPPVIYPTMQSYPADMYSTAYVGAFRVTPVSALPAANPDANPTCPAGYSGPTNPATGCPFWLMVASSPAG
jgi:hypothetical protein